MSREVKNEGLEVVARNFKTREGYDVWDKLCAIPKYGFLIGPSGGVVKVLDVGNWIDRDEAQSVVDVAQTELNETRSEALAGHAVRDARIAELEDELDFSSKILARQAEDNTRLRAELAAIKEQEPVGRLPACPSRAFAVANLRDLAQSLLQHDPDVGIFRDEDQALFINDLADLAESFTGDVTLYAAPVAKQVVMPEREWLQSGGLIYSLENDVNYYEINVTQVEGSRHDGQRAELAGKLIELLNAADQEGGV